MNYHPAAIRLRPAHIVFLDFLDGKDAPAGVGVDEHRLRFLCGLGVHIL